MGKIPAGVRKGHLNWLGDFKECIQIEQWKDQESRQDPPDFQGEYCLVYIIPITAQGHPVSFSNAGTSVQCSNPLQCTSKGHQRRH